ncbi:MAG: hypothetical protein C0482_00955 [Gordonia sp.]|nr:hypothetical protein [Gordonia sp. (in: high G+C Gram-positive bacteria)]
MSYDPSDKQRAVINATAPVIVVLGGAGSGKTTTAAATAAKRLADDDARRAALQRSTPIGSAPTITPTGRIMFLSFSRTSVSQILDRAASVLGTHQSRIEVVTFHGFAWRVLRDFGRHYGVPHPLRVRSAAEMQLGIDLSGLTYDELIPEALRVLRIPAVAAIYERRYLAVICDEFQDTSDVEWEFMQAISPSSQRLLLGDVNQCIYAGMKKIDPSARVNEALTLTSAKEIRLAAQSYRDPSGVLPAAALAALGRQFSDPAIAEAVRGERLKVHRASGDAAVDSLALEVVKGERAQGKSVSIFTHTNVATADLSTRLAVSGIDHEQVGFAEAYGEGLQAQFQLLRWALIRKPGGRQALAIYLRSILRGKAAANAQCHAIIEKSNPEFEASLRGVIADLQSAAQPSPDVDAILSVLRSMHDRLGFPRGRETWILANRQLKRASRCLQVGNGFDSLTAEVARLRAEELVGIATGRSKPVQVMNLHQTKGREADATVLVLQNDEYHGSEKTEPFAVGSRLLYVCMTRARERAHIIVPDNVHPLWRPLINACIGVANDAST